MRPGGPGALSGRIAVGDVLVQVDGDVIADMEAAAARLVGPVGSGVWLRVGHASGCVYSSQFLVRQVRRTRGREVGGLGGEREREEKGRR